MAAEAVRFPALGEYALETMSSYKAVPDRLLEAAAGHERYFDPAWILFLNGAG